MKDDLLEVLLKYSYLANSTDLHLCTGTKPLMRSNGALVEIPGAEVTSIDKVNEIINSLLDSRQKDILNRERVIDFSFSRPGLGRFRANIYSQRGTYAMAIRMLPFKIPGIQQLGLPEVIEKFVDKSKGLFLVTGSTGSGKSTTLASMLNIINEKHRYHIITIEDPIEYLHKNKNSLVTQREIGQDASSFAQALRSALREDPDVIMVGEMRDPETISIALTAAETGHLVLSTLHTIGAAKSVDRMVDAFPPGQQGQIKSQLATVLEGVISQQLLPRKDKKGIVLAYEMLVMNSAIRNLIREGKTHQVNNIIQTGQEQGMQLMEANIANLCNRGLVNYVEITPYIQDQKLFAQLYNNRR